MTLSEVLTKDGLLTQDQLTEAQADLAVLGGRLESHIFRLGYMTESELVGILAKNTGYAGVCLSGKVISDNVLDAIPPEIAWQREIVPVSNDPSSGSIRVACVNPGDNDLRADLAEIFPDYKIEFCLALDVTLRSAVVRHYRQPLPKKDTPTDAFQHISAAVRTAEQEPEETTPAPVSADPIHARILILNGMTTNTGRAVEQLLSHQGHKITWTESIGEYVKVQSELHPDVAVVLAEGNLRAVAELVENLASHDSRLSDQPTFLISPDIQDDELGDMLRMGFEDVVPAHYVLDLLVIKIRRVRERLTAERHKRVEIMRDLGTHGSLEDMNVIDLLQSMGPTGKTARISVTGNGNQLIVCLDKGQIIHAECEPHVGAEAIYAALSWERGIWNVDPLEPDDLPSPNIFMSNDGILLEGCRRADEGKRDEAGESKPPNMLDDIENATQRLNELFDQLG